MYIQLEVEDSHAEHLLFLQKRLNKPLSEVLTAVLASGIDALVDKPKVNTKGEAFNIMKKYHLIGCMDDDANLSTNYKEKLWNHE